MSDLPLLVMLRPLGLGDFLTGIPAYRALARAFPEHRCVLAAPVVLAPLAALLPETERFVDTTPLAPLPQELHHADIAVDLHGRGPASHRVLLASQPRRLIAFANDEIPESHGFAPWTADEHERVRWCRMLSHVGIPADPTDFRLPAPPPPFPEMCGATVVHPGAKSAARRWPLERFAEVVRAEESAGRHVYITGGPTDVERATELAERAGLASTDRILAGRTTLADLARVAAHAGRVICGDTGLAHLATAFGTPSVVLFGPVSPAHWGPPPSEIHRVLWHGRTGDPHGEHLDPGLSEISVADVLGELAALDRVKTPA